MMHKLQKLRKASAAQVMKGRINYCKARIHGKHLACRAPRGGNLSLGVGVSFSCAIGASLLINISAQCQYRYACEGTTLDSMVDKSITAF